MELEIIFSKESEVARIKHTINRFGWYKEKGYRINLPGKIKEFIDQGNIPTDEEILDIVSKEFDPKQYEEKKRELELKFQEKKGGFEQNIGTLGLPLQPIYRILLTKYGVGGSYFLPNTVLINFNYPNVRDILTNTLHEIIHLTIEEVIQKYKTEHWAKERIVDLTYEKFFPENNKILQRDPKQSEQIYKIFDQSFPNIQTIIIEVSKLDNSVVSGSIGQS
jgi:hypothetical protein